MAEYTLFKPLKKSFMNEAIEHVGNLKDPQLANAIFFNRLESKLRANLEGRLPKGESDKDMEEIEIKEGNMNLSRSKCEVCIVKNPFVESVSEFLCFTCDIYVCAACIPDHRLHEGMRVGTQVREGEEERKERERVEELIERERMRRVFLDKLMNESETERIEKFNNSHVCMYDRVNITHELDIMQGCTITGLCGLENKMWAVCDCLNSCIKVFKLGSNMLQRLIHIRYGTEPWDVTETIVKQNSTEPNLVSGGSSDNSVSVRAAPDKQCLIGVTLPRKRQILFIDLNKKPALKHKVFHSEKQCWSIQSCVDKIFTVCREGPHSPCYVYVYSTDGDTLNKFLADIGEFPFSPRLSVFPKRIYLTDHCNHKLQCRNEKGQFIAEITIEGAGPRGTSVDPDNNVFVCAGEHTSCLKVYKLDSGITQYKSVLAQSTGYKEIPDALCFHKDKLFISHCMSPSLSDFVTVVRLL